MEVATVYFDVSKARIKENTEAHKEFRTTVESLLQTMDISDQDLKTLRSVAEEVKNMDPETKRKLGSNLPMSKERMRWRH